VILAKTIKGWTLGRNVEARNATHQIKKMSPADLKAFRDRLHLEVSDRDLDDGIPPYLHPGRDSDEFAYLMERRRALGGAVPRRRVSVRALPDAGDDTWTDLLAGTGPRVQASTTSAFARLLRKLLDHPELGRRVVPIIPDEARTFGLDALFRDVKIYSPVGQLYEPVDAGLLLQYREAVDGRILEEGISEALSMASTTAVGTAHATWGQAMIPFYIFYSMFGFQRIGDLIWSFGDQRGRGFLLGATAGRTTLMGEGLQHCDGHSPVLASVHPSCRVYDPAFAYELAVIIRDGLARMYGPDPEDCFYYLTLYNETYPMPPMPAGVGEGILAGMYRFRAAPRAGRHRAHLLAAGAMVPRALEAQELLADGHDVAADVWSVTSFTELARDAARCERWNRLHPTAEPRVPYVTRLLEGADGPVVAVSDFVKALPAGLGRHVPEPFSVLGTDGWGLSDTRDALRRHFEVDAAHMVVAVLDGLARRGERKREDVAEAIARHGIDPEAPDPRDAAA
jgi:pyruvate dehydrogenase E1 component